MSNTPSDKHLMHPSDCLECHGNSSDPITTDEKLNRILFLLEEWRPYIERAKKLMDNPIVRWKSGGGIGKAPRI